MKPFPRALLCVAACGVSLSLDAGAQTPPMTPDVPAKFVAPTDRNDYAKREAMIPMRDGVKLFTVMIVPKGVKDAPILLTRTPYNAKRNAERTVSPYAAATGAQMDEL